MKICNRITIKWSVKLTNGLDDVVKWQGTSPILCRRVTKNGPWQRRAFIFQSALPSWGNSCQTSHLIHLAHSLRIHSAHFLGVWIKLRFSSFWNGKKHGHHAAVKTFQSARYVTKIYHFICWRSCWMKRSRAIYSSSPGTSSFVTWTIHKLMNIHLNYIRWNSLIQLKVLLWTKTPLCGGSRN